MKFTPVDKPIKRSKIRAKAGKNFFIMKRFLKWILSSGKYAKTYSPAALPFLHFSHSSVLLRKLKDVDMRLQYNKIDNLRLAVRPLHHLIIRPREIFSFWYLVGRPAKSRGFKPGMVLQNGKVGEGYGGGLCQLGNLLYWMALHTPLKVTERYRHGFDVFPDVNRKVPFGCGATLSYNYIDLQIENPTDQNFQLNLWLTETDLCGEIRSDKAAEHTYEIIEADHRIQGEFWGGYTRHNRIIRKAFDINSKELINEELITENHAIMMYNPLLEQ